MAALSFALVGVSASRAEACSLAGPALTVPGTAEAGGTLEISGIGFFTLEGDLGADCSGDFRLVALTDVEVRVEFARLSGSSTVRLAAPVSGPAGGSPDLIDGDRFTIGPLEVPVPDDATSATVSSEQANAVTVTITGADPSTTTTLATPSVDTPAPGPEAPDPAAPVPGAPRYTG
jgi:hypothetical protein